MKEEMDWCCIAAVNNIDVLEQNLARSPALQRSPARLIVKHGQPSSSIAYNVGLNQTQSRICIFAHQDVYLPENWEVKLRQKIDALEKYDPSWAVIGLYGIDLAGKRVGRVWDTGIQRELGSKFNSHIPVQSLDELLLVVNRNSGLRFDENLPSFHLYGTDIVQTAIASGKGAYVVDVPVVHNSLPVATVRGGFAASYKYMQNKWRDRLPISTPVTCITRGGWEFVWQDIRRFRLSVNRRKRVRAALSGPRPDPRKIALELGYE
ncbi:hypothetical protein [Rhodosalinus sp. K401]|uniref:hypothetical protein n=1 Tax=Rhodosalinus sp. K401 TaxID=3239195 RepID=UPI0035261160